MKKNNSMSVCIPAYEMNGKGAEYLRFNLSMLAKQSFLDFEVVISDNSKNDDVYNVCALYVNALNLKYVKNDKKFGISANLNNAIYQSSGDIVKILFQDDFLYSDNSLQEIFENFDTKKDAWLVTASEHTLDGKVFFKPFVPYYHDKIFLGRNTISSPSVLTLARSCCIGFDENLTWLMDVDFYKRMYDKYGTPKICRSINIVNRVGSHQVSNSLITKKIKKKETLYVRAKFFRSLSFLEKLKYHYDCY